MMNDDDGDDDDGDDDDGDDGASFDTTSKCESEKFVYDKPSPNPNSGVEYPSPPLYASPWWFPWYGYM